MSIGVKSNEDEDKSKHEDERKKDHNCEGPLAFQGYAHLKVHKQNNPTGFWMYGFVNIYQCSICGECVGTINDTKVRV